MDRGPCQASRPSAAPRTVRARGQEQGRSHRQPARGCPVRPEPLHASPENRSRGRPGRTHSCLVLRNGWLCSQRSYVGGAPWYAKKAGQTRWSVPPSLQAFPRVLWKPPRELTHLRVTVAPAPSRAALAFSATSLATFSRTTFGAPSTTSLASFRPRLVRARTSLMTWIFVSPTVLSLIHISEPTR